MPQQRRRLGAHEANDLLGLPVEIDLTAQRFAPASRSAGSVGGNRPLSFSSTIRAKFGGVGGRFDVTRSTKLDSDCSHSESHLLTSATDEAIGRSSNAIGSLACAGSTTISGA